MGCTYRRDRTGTTKREENNTHQRRLVQFSSTPLLSCVYNLCYNTEIQSTMGTLNNQTSSFCLWTEVFDNVQTARAGRRLEQVESTVTGFSFDFVSRELWNSQFGSRCSAFDQPEQTGKVWYQDLVSWTRTTFVDGCHGFTSWAKRNWPAFSAATRESVVYTFSTTKTSTLSCESSVSKGQNNIVSWVFLLWHNKLLTTRCMKETLERPRLKSTKLAGVAQRASTSSGQCRN